MSKRLIVLNLLIVAVLVCLPVVIKKDSIVNLAFWSSCIRLVGLELEYPGRICGAD